MKQRIISALIAIPLFLAIILFAPQPIYLAFWHLCIIACSYEFFKIRGLSKINSLITAAVVGSIAPVVCYLWVYLPFSEDIKIMTFFLTVCLSIFIPIIWIIIIPFLFKKYNKNQEYKSNNVLLFPLWFFIISYFYIFAFMSSLDFGIEKNIDHFNLILRLGLLLTLVTIWANDAGAYFVGKAIGKRKFSPIISPNKTWEGFWGGMVVAVIVYAILNVLLAKFTGGKYMGALLSALYTAPLISIFATIGDLFQSMLKRMAGVKDSGNIMPGHGGVFDRIDSWLAVGSLSAMMSLLFLALLLIFLSFGTKDDTEDFSGSLKTLVQCHSS